MPKLKTKKTIAKRFKITSTGKVIRGHLAARHRMFHKDTRRRRRFSEPIVVGEKMAKAIKSVVQN
ncbi:50S ribosomal protein L35 [Patescibacteria group bacterium]|nr:50S ribosomal protein L35 [Patescibacteria group bacterium]MCL5797621.1 50S ribosomal protein L35 [Patescibacteria group bacterium]